MAVVNGEQFRHMYINNWLMNQPKYEDFELGSPVESSSWRITTEHFEIPLAIYRNMHNSNNDVKEGFLPDKCNNKFPVFFLLIIVYCMCE